MTWSTERDSITGEEYIAVDVRGEALLRDPATNKGTAFTAAEREELGLDGLMPAAVSTMDQQLARVYENFRAKQTSLERYIHLASLQDRNETLFFRLVHDHIDEMMSDLPPNLGARLAGRARADTDRDLVLGRQRRQPRLDQALA